MSGRNLRAMFERADADDRREGRLAYARYSEVLRNFADATKRLAKREGLLPNQVQATIWFARKRTERVKYNPQLSLFGDPSDKWGTYVAVEAALPYTGLGR